MIARESLRPVIAANVKRLRQTAGWTQEQLAQKAGIGRVYVAKIERGHGDVSAVVLFRIADAFGVSSDSLRQIS